MKRKSTILLLLFLLAVILSACSMMGKTDEFGCFPPSCAMIPQENVKRICEEWTSGAFVWGNDCSKAGSQACTQLCEQDTAALLTGKEFKPLEGIMKFLPSEVDIYGRDWYTEEKDLPLTGTIYAFGPSLQSGVMNIKWLKDRGAEKVYAGISVWNEDAWKTVEQLPEELKTAFVTGFTGEPLFIQEDVFLNILDPAYLRWIMERVKEQIDFGTDGFTFDEHWGTEAALSNGDGPCDEYALKGFRNYLAEKYSTSDLLTKGVSDIQTFDYCQYVVDNNLLEKYKENYRLVNFGLDYQDYLFRASNAVIKEIIQDAKSYAAEKGRNILIGANYEPTDRLDEFDFFNSLDTFVFEHEWFPRWRNEGDYAQFAAGVPVSPSMKYAFSQDTNAAAMYVIYDAGALSDQNVDGGTKLVLHQMAESYANRGHYMYFDLVDYLGLNFQANRTLLYPYYMFLRNHPQAFLDLQQPNNLAVTLPPRATVDYRNTTDALAISIALSEANIQHDVIDLDKINEYDTIVVTGFAWSEDEVNTLLNFAENGGTVVAFDHRFASLDENYQEVEYAVLRNFKTNGTHAFGDGKIIFLNENLGEKIWQFQSPSDKEKILAAVASGAFQNITPEKIQVLPYQHDTVLVIHILNYDFENWDFVQKEGATIKIQIPDGFSTADKTLTIISPDLPNEEIVNFEIENEMIVFTLPSLYIWDIAILE